MKENLIRLKRLIAGIIDILVYTLFYLIFFTVEGYFLKKNSNLVFFSHFNLILNLIFTLFILIRDYISPGKFFTRIKINNRSLKNSFLRNFPFSLPFLFSSFVPFIKKYPITSKIEFFFVSIPIIYTVMELTLMLLGSGNRIMDRFVKVEFLDKSNIKLK